MKALCAFNLGWVNHAHEDNRIKPRQGEEPGQIVKQLANVMAICQQQLTAIEAMSPDPENEASRVALMKDVRVQLATDHALKEDITRLIASLPKTQRKEEKVGEWRNRLLLTDPMEDRRGLIDTMGERVGSTCEWFPQCATYHGYIEGRTPFLWLHGETGKGKTTLSIFLSEQLSVEAAKPNTHLIYYFCGRQDERRNTATAVLRGLLWQLTLKAELTGCIARHLEQHVEILLSEAESLWRLFAALMNDSECGTVYCVLDGLDELEDDNTLWMAKKFLSLFSPGAREPHLNVLRLLLVTRNMPDFRLRGQSTQLSLDTDANGDVEYDIRKVVDAKLTAVPDWDVFNEDYKEQVRSEILLKANGSFVPISIIMNALVERPYSGILETVQSLPQGLEALYGSTLLGIQDASQQRQEAPEVLRWVAMAFRPLSLQELADAVGGLAESAIRATVQRCGALLKEHQDTVIFTHTSARDYLLRSATDHPTQAEQFDQAQADMIDQLRIDPQEAHLEIALKCLQLIKESHLQHRILDSHDDWEASPLLKYAVIYWPHHARGSGDVGKKLFTATSFVLSKETQLTNNWWKTYLHERPGEEWEQGEKLSPLHIVSDSRASLF